MAIWGSKQMRQKSVIFKIIRARNGKGFFEEKKMNFPRS
jgi:hypothetical protein